MRKKELKKRVEELEEGLYAANQEALAAAKTLEDLGAYAITSQTVYVSADSPYIGAAAVLDKLLTLDPSPTSLTVSVQYIPPGDDGEASYFAASATGSI